MNTATATNNKRLAKSEQQNEHLTAYGSLQKPNTQQQTKPHYMGHWWEPNSKPNDRRAWLILFIVIGVWLAS